MPGHKFNPEHAERLNDPSRLELFQPDTMWAVAAVRDPREIVDIGAGTGLITAQFARLAPHATVYAADLSEDMLAYLAAHLPADVADRVKPVHVEESRVPLPSGIADLVTMVALFHELDDVPASLAEVQRLLAPGGRLLIVDWSKEDTGHGPPMEMRRTAEEIVAALTEAGFAVPHVHPGMRGLSVVTATRLRGCQKVHD